MAQKRQFIIARDGWWFAGICLAAALTLFQQISPLAALPALLALLVVFVLFRNPHRMIPPIPQGVVCPADGKLEIAERGQCPFYNLDGYHLRIRRRFWSPYFIRSPIEAQVCELARDNLPDNGHAWQLVTDEGDTLVMMTSGDHFLSNRSFRPRYGERIGQGQRAGTRRLGKVLDLWLPENARVLMEAGSSVKAGSDVLAKLVHKNV